MAEIESLKVEVQSLKSQMATERKVHIDEMERQRINFETVINDLKRNLNLSEQENVKLRSTVLELKTRLDKKADVEKQCDLWKAHHDSMEASKRDLQVQLEGASSYITQLEEKYYESQQ